MPVSMESSSSDEFPVNVIKSPNYVEKLEKPPPNGTLLIVHSI